MAEDLEKAYGGLVRHIAWQCWQDLSAQQRRHYALVDLVHSGWIGLLQAWSRFDPGRHVRPSTFITYRVRGSILDALRKDDPLPQARRQQYREVECAQEQLRQQYGREPAIGEIAEALGVKEDEIHTLLRDAQSAPARLDARPEPASASNDPETEVLRRACVEDLWACMRGLKALQYQLVLRRHFEEPQPTLHAMAACLGLPPSTVYGQLGQAYASLRRCLQAKGWEVSEISDLHD